MAENGLDKPAPLKTCPIGIVVVANLMILFGLAEVATGFTHNFIGILSTTTASLSTILGVMLGVFYFIGGLLLLTMRRGAALTAIILLCGDVLGRVAMIVTGLYPADSFKQSFAILVGTAIAIFFAFYILLKIKVFVH